MKQKSENKNAGRSLYTSLLLLLVAIVAVTAVTTAWLSLADHTRVYSMVMDVTSGSNIRFDLDPHETIGEYTRTLNFRQISERILSEKGFDPRTVPLDPVTTRDCVTFTVEDGTVVPANKGSYLEFTLHFMASRDLVVHLTSLNSNRSQDGTMISSSVEELPKAMRISFSDGASTWVYDPGLGDTVQQTDNMRIFGLPPESQMIYSDNNAMFSLHEGVNKPITVRLWLEGTDEACTDVLQDAKYEIQLRFEATDENNNIIETNPRANT